MLATATLIAPVLEYINARSRHDPDLVFVICASMVLFSLVVGRMAGLVRQPERGAARERSLNAIGEFVAVAVAIANGLVLGAHRALVPVLIDPERLAVRRAELQQELARVQLAAEEAEDVDLSVGRDGLALASCTSATEDLLGGVVRGRRAPPRRRAHRKLD